MRNNRGQFSKNHKVPQEWIKNMVQAHRGKELSIEHKNKISKANKGKKRSEETRKKMRHPHKKFSEETKRKISEAHKGHPSNAFKGKKYKRYYHTTHTPEYIKWRLAIFERDKYTCIGCGLIGGYLEAHHIKSWAEYPELRNEITNGITLCKECHKLTDNYKNKKHGK